MKKERIITRKFLFRLVGNVSDDPIRGVVHLQQVYSVTRSPTTRKESTTMMNRLER